MRTDTVGQPIYFLDTDSQSAETEVCRNMFLASASEAYGHEAAGLLADRIENLMRNAFSSNRPCVLACVKNTDSGPSFEVAIVGEHEQEVLAYPIPADISATEASECMTSVISLVVGMSGGVTDMLVNQILCQAHHDPLSALRDA